MKKFTRLFLIFQFCFLIAFSQPPQSFKYQSVLRNRNGGLLSNKPLNARISILAGNIGGNTVYCEIHSVTSNSFGMINIDIGKGINKSGNFSGINWGSNKYFIKLEIDTIGKRSYYFMGMSQMLSVPYSINSSGLTLTSPNGSLWSVKIDNSGNLYPVKIDNDSTFHCGGNLKDSRDNKTYKTIQIGNQCWMAQNLNTGTMIQVGQAATDNKIIEKYCYSNNQNKCEQYGGLYTWNEMMNFRTAEGSQGICPAGWHLPTDYEWKKLEIYLGMTEAAADTTGWRSENVGTKLKVNGSSGFNAILAGYSSTLPAFVGENSIAVFWSSSEEDINTSWQRFLYIEKGGVSRINGAKGSGYSVRCLEN